MKSTIVIIWICCSFVKVSQSQYHHHELHQPELEDCYCIDTYKTDSGDGDELVRTERCLLKKMFKNWGRRFHNDCVQCCQNNAGYEVGSAGNGDYNGNSYTNQQYEPSYSPPNIPMGSHGHIYLPLPPPRRFNLFNRPFRRGYGGNMGRLGGYNGNTGGSGSYAENMGGSGGYGANADGSGTYPPKEAYVEEKPVVAPVEEIKDSDYKSPVVEDTPNYTEKPAVSSEESVEKKDDYSGKSEHKEDKKNDYDSEDKKGEYEKTVTPVTTQVIQPIVPIIAPPLYVYQPQYYSPQVSYVQPAQLYSPPAPSYSPQAPSYSPSAPLYIPMSYASPSATYSPPISSYAPLPPSYLPPISSHLPAPAPSYSPSAPLSPPYSPPTESYSPMAPSPTPSTQSYSPPDSSYSTSYSPPVQSYSAPSLCDPEPDLSYSSLESYSGPLPNYYKTTYSTSLTYLLPSSPSPSPCSYPTYEIDQPMRSCPELFTSYGSSMTPSYPY